MENKKGRILKIDSTKSFVLEEEERQIYICDLKGKLRKSQKPVVGDFVEFEIIDFKNNYGIINNIFKRINELYRPKIANIDQVMIISSVKDPDLTTTLLNKYIFMLEVKKIKPILVFTKIDKLNSKDFEISNIINNYKKLDYNVLTISNLAFSQKNEDNFLDFLRNKITIFVGQSGVGKSTTLNNFLIFDKKLKTQEVSKFLNRGKHTTTNLQLYQIEKDILIADTPGFSSFDLQNIAIEELLQNISIFKKYLGMCQFSDCKHINEKKCYIKLMVDTNEIPKFIYEDYKNIYFELLDKKEKY